MTSLGDTTGKLYVACLKKATCENVIVLVNFSVYVKEQRLVQKYSFRVNRKYLI